MSRLTRTAVLAVVATAMIATAAPAYASMANDSSAGAIELAAGTPVTTDTSAADPGLSAGEVAPSCVDASHTVWYAFTLDQRARVLVSTFGSKFDTVLAVYDATLSEVGCNDDDLDVGSLQSRLRMRLPAGTYLVQAGSYGAPGATGGNLRLTLEVESLVPGASYLSPIELALPASLYLDFATTGGRGPHPGCMQYSEKALWYSVVAPEAGVLQVTSGDEMTDVYVAIFDTDGTELSCTDDWPADRGFARIAAGQELLVAVGWWDFGSTMTPLAAEIVPAAVNDEIEGALTLPLRTETAGTLAGSSGSPDDPDMYQCNGDDGRTAWYTATIDQDGSYLLDLVTDGHMHVSVFRGSELLACENLQTFEATAGDVLTIAVHDHAYWPAHVDEFTLELQRGVIVDGIVAGAIVREDNHVYAGVGAPLVWAGADVDPEHRRAWACVLVVLTGVCQDV